LRNLKIILFLSLINITGFSQDNNFNLVIFLNDELIENVYNFKVFENDSLQYNSEYTIGELIISDSFDRQKFKVKALEDVKFKFTIIAGTTNISKHNDYEVVFKKLFLEGKFLVIRLYNLESKKYKKRLKKKSLKYDCNIYSNGVFKLNL
jgi:hypothetical protein